MRNRSTFAALAAASALIASISTAQAAPKEDDSRRSKVGVESIDLLGQVVFPTGTTYNSTVVGGLSGITFDPATGQYLAISDDRSQSNPARFYTLDIDLADGALGAGDVQFTAVTELKRADGSTYPALSIDPEGIALGPNGTVFISSEGEANVAAGRVFAPFVNQYRRADGVLVAELPVPSAYTPTPPTSGIRNNLAFESLTISPDGKTLVTATENALVQDGPAATTTLTSPSRVLVYEQGKPKAEYRFDTNRVVREPIPATNFATNGLVELLSINDNGSYLALERSFSAGIPGTGNDVSLYEFSLDNSSRLKQNGTIGGVAPLRKELVLNLADLGIPLDNLEGMTFGPRLADGRRSLVVVSDNNFSATQSTQFLAFAVDVSGDKDDKDDKDDKESQLSRFATFNVSLNRSAPGLLVSDLSSALAADAVQELRRQQARNVAEVVQRVRPDVLLLNEFDYVEGNVAVDLFRDNYLEVGQNGAKPIEYPFAYVAPSNTGVPSGFDLNNNGVIGGGDDAFGFGFFPGQFGMAVFSKHPIRYDDIRTFQLFKWKDMPGNLIPTPFYSPEEVAILRLSSKSHWDIPVQVRGRIVHVLASHPTPPVFDGPEDRNGRRNHDEIRLWADYVDPVRSGYLYDDQGRTGGLAAGESFVIMGDQNADPKDGDSFAGAISQLLGHPLVLQSPAPSSAGGAAAAALQGGANTGHLSDPRFDTADFSDAAPGNLRADYVLPSAGLTTSGSGVFWPAPSDQLSRLTGVFNPAWNAVGGFPTSDHRLVWVDVLRPPKN